MDLKKTKMKIARTKDKIKTTIKQNPDLAIAIASQAAGAAALVVAWLACKKLEETNSKLRRERRDHAECHSFAGWVIREVERDGTEKLIKFENDAIHIQNKPESNTETTED